MAGIETLYRQDPTQIERGYDFGKPLEMLCVPASDSEAARIRDKVVPFEGVLSTEKIATREDAIRNSFSFLEVYGRKGGSSDNQVACLSMGLSWDRQTNYSPVATDTIRSIVGNSDTLLVHYGKRKWVAFMRGKQELDGLMQRVVSAPIRPYEKYLSHLAPAQRAIQLERQEDILGIDGTGRNWMDVFEGKRDGFKRGYEDDGRMSMWWAYRQKGDELEGVGINNEPITLTELAQGAFELDTFGDILTGNIILDIQKFLAFFDSEDRFVIQIDGDRDAVCCNDAFNAQQADVWESDVQRIVAESKIPENVTLTLVYPNGEKYSRCDSCGQAHTEKKKCDKKAA